MLLQPQSPLPGLQDRRTSAAARIMPIIDAQQDWNLEYGIQDNGFTTLEFFRLLDTGDTTGDRVIQEVQRRRACMSGYQG